VSFLHFDAEAQGFFDEWLADLERGIRAEDEHPVIAAHYGKYRSLMPSLALIFHCCDAGPRGRVSLEAARRAAAWCHFLGAHAQRIYHSVAYRVDSTTRLLGKKDPRPQVARSVFSS
jgi:putative DNA primase/helicase